MKKSVVISVVLSLTILSSAFASSITDTETKKSSVEITKTKKEGSKLSEAEAKFYNELDAFYYETFEKPANELINGENESETKKIVVYDLEGDIITTKYEELPANASFLMAEGETIFYITY